MFREMPCWFAGSLSLLQRVWLDVGCFFETMLEQFVALVKVECLRLKGLLQMTTPVVAISMQLTCIAAGNSKELWKSSWSLIILCLGDHNPWTGTLQQNQPVKFGNFPLGLQLLDIYIYTYIHVYHIIYIICIITYIHTYVYIISLNLSHITMYPHGSPLISPPPGNDFAVTRVREILRETKVRWRKMWSITETRKYHTLLNIEKNQLIRMMMDLRWIKFHPEMQTSWISG